MLSKEKVKELKAQANAIKPFASIGKNGITENSIAQIKNYLKAHNLCKIKLFRSFLDESGKNKKDLAAQIAIDTDSELVQLVGFTIILYKR